VNFPNQEPDTTVNLNIRVSRNLKNMSSSLLQNMGINQSQYIRDALQYVVSHNTLPWLQGSGNSVIYKFSPIQSILYSTVDQISQGIPIDTMHIGTLCAQLDELQIYITRELDAYYDKGCTSIHLSKLNSLLLQLTSLLRHSNSHTGTAFLYAPITSNQMRILLQSIDETIRVNAL